MTKMSTVEARDHFSELINRAAYGKERIILTRRGKPLAAVIPMEDFETLEELENRWTVQAVREALAESDERIPYGKVRRELGLSDE